jgi:O-acetyl-ADP-ribose deacetylase (regulator of RNase III)
MAVSKRWPETRERYLEWYNDRAEDDNAFKLGNVQVIPVEKYIWVVNMVAQRGIKTGSNGVPIRYPALKSCLEKVAEFIQTIQDMPVSVHMPRIGCGLAGGKWEAVEPLIVETLSACPVYVYDY